MELWFEERVYNLVLKSLILIFMGLQICEIAHYQNFEKYWSGLNADLMSWFSSL